MLTRVAEVMSTTVITVPGSTGVVEAAQLMVGRGKGALPIVDGERVVGIGVIGPRPGSEEGPGHRPFGLTRPPC